MRSLTFKKEKILIQILLTNKNKKIMKTTNQSEQPVDKQANSKSKKNLFLLSSSIMMMTFFSCCFSDTSSIPKFPINSEPESDVYIGRLFSESQLDYDTLKLVIDDLSLQKSYEFDMMTGSESDQDIGKTEYVVQNQTLWIAGDQLNYIKKLPPALYPYVYVFYIYNPNSLSARVCVGIFIDISTKTPLEKITKYTEKLYQDHAVPIVVKLSNDTVSAIDDTVSDGISDGIIKEAILRKRLQELEKGFDSLKVHP